LDPLLKFTTTLVTASCIACINDMIVNDAVLVEIKIAPQHDRRDEAQLLNVLKATGLKVGILLNFGRYKVEYRRFIF
jgi:GxxExxY protein